MSYIFSFLKNIHESYRTLYNNIKRDCNEKRKQERMLEDKLYKVFSFFVREGGRRRDV